MQFKKLSLTCLLALVSGCVQLVCEISETLLYVVTST